MEDIIQDEEELRDYLTDRSIIVRKLKTLPFEAIVRGYVIGSGWKEYQNTGSICGVSLPPHLEASATTRYSNLYPIY